MDKGGGSGEASQGQPHSLAPWDEEVGPEGSEGCCQQAESQPGRSSSTQLSQDGQHSFTAYFSNQKAYKTGLLDILTMNNH